MSHIEENFFGEVGQKALIEKDGKILMCQTQGEDNWDFPGGRLQKDENPKDGLLREIQEELGRDDIEIGSPLYTFSAIPKSGVPRFFVLYSCSLQNSDENFVFENEVAQVRWVSEEEVETLPMAKEWKSALDDYFKTSGKY